jgi:hypothetical protein
MLEKLFAGGDSVLMEQKNHTRFSGAMTALSKVFKGQYEGTMFVRNWVWSMRGLGMLLLAIWFVALVLVLTDSSGAAPSVAKPLAVGSAGVLIVAALLFRSAPPRGSPGRTALLVFAWIAGLAGFGLGLATFTLALATGRVLPLLIPLLALPVVISAFWWMAAPTRAGRALLDRIAGFRQYLSTTEEERLERLHPPEKTPELFERYLPYAIAMGVENGWADRFSGVLAAASAAGQTQGMHWYSGHSDPWSDPGSFTDRVGSSLSSTVASASSAPGSSSGSGGGGSSGGGGGGGGGGGW